MPLLSCQGSCECLSLVDWFASRGGVVICLIRWIVSPIVGSWLWLWLSDFPGGRLRIPLPCRLSVVFGFCLWLWAGGTEMTVLVLLVLTLNLSRLLARYFCPSFRLALGLTEEGGRSFVLFRRCSTFLIARLVCLSVPRVVPALGWCHGWRVLRGDLAIPFFPLWSRSPIACCFLEEVFNNLLEVHAGCEFGFVIRRGGKAVYASWWSIPGP